MKLVSCPLQLDLLPTQSRQSLVTRKYGINLVLDASISASFDLTANKGFQTTFDGSKNKENELVDFGVGIGTGLLGNATESVFDRNKSRAFFKSFTPEIRTRY